MQKKLQDILEEAELQRRGNDSDDGDDDGDRVEALLDNALEGNTAEVVRLLEAKADVDGRDVVSSAPRLRLPSADDIGPSCMQDGYTPLMYAAAGNKVEVAKVLMDRGAEIDAKDDVRSSIRVTSS